VCTNSRALGDVHIRAQGYAHPFLGRCGPMHFCTHLMTVS
jgi:hypothetical protein